MSVINITNSTEGVEWDLSKNVQNKSDLNTIYMINFPSYFVNGTISILTILFNSILIISMRTHGRKFPQVVRHQLISLGTSDLIAGIAPGLLCLTIIPTVNERARICITLHLIFNISQYATLLNLFHLSARRWKVLLKSSQPTFRPASRVPLVFVFTSLAWLTSILLHLPYLAGVTTELNINGCFSPELLKNHDFYIYIMSLFLLTLLALDIFFIHSLVILRNQKRVSAQCISAVSGAQGSSNPVDPVLPRIGNPMSQPKKIFVKEQVQPGCSYREEMTQPKPFSVFQSHKHGIHFAWDKERPQCSLMPDNSPLTRLKGAAQNETQMRIIADRTKNTPQQSTNPRRQTAQSNSYRLQQRAFIHLLAALIVINLSTIPNLGVIISILMDTLQFEPENVPIIDMQLLSLNSLLNPLVYGIILKEVRIAVKEQLRKLGRCFR